MIEINAIVIDLINKSFKLYRGPARSFIKDFTVYNSLVYDVGMDQSNSCTGITMESLDGSVLVILEVVNAGVAFTYYRTALLTILRHLTVGIDIRYFVMEKPLPYTSGKRNKALNELKKILEEFFKNEPNLKINQFDEIFPQSWRAGLMQKDNPYDKRSKSACVHEVKKLYPFISEFVKITHNPTDDGGFDGIESCGIINGYRKRYDITNDNLAVKIVGPKNTTKVALSIFCYEDNNLEELKRCIQEIKFINPKLGEPKIKYYNNEEGVYANSKMSLIDDFTLTSVTKQLDIIAILHLFGLKEISGNQLYMIVVPLNLLKANFYEKLKNLGCKIEVFY